MKTYTEPSRTIPVAAEAIVAFLRKYAPGYEHCYVVTSASQIGVRETRHFRTLHTMTEDDIVEARQFDDWIATRNHFNFDIHNTKGAGLDANGAQQKFRAKGKYTIPYRSAGNPPPRPSRRRHPDRTTSPGRRTVR